MRRALATVGTSVVLLTLSVPIAPPAGAAGPTASLFATIDTSTWIPPSPDPSGLTWWPAKGRLVVVDAEVEEMSIYAGANTFESDVAGTLLRTSDTSEAQTGFSDEPTDVAADGNTLYFSEDDGDEIFVVDVGPDGDLDTADDTRTSFDTLALGIVDPEGIAYGDGSLFVADGVGTQVHRIDPGPNELFDGADDRVTCFDARVLGMRDPEGVAVDPATGHLYLVSRRDFNRVATVTTSGAMVDLIASGFPSSVEPSGVTVAPANDPADPTRMDLYVSDRGVDNGVDPLENDGKIYELKLSPTAAARAPVTAAPGAQPPGPTGFLAEGELVTLQFVATDPNGDAISYSASGLPPGLSIDVATGLISGTIAPGAAMFSPYASTLSASDGTLTASRNVTWRVAVRTPNQPPVITRPGDQTGAEGDLATLPVVASDPDNTVMYSASGLPPGLWMDCATGTIQGTIQDGAASGSPYTVRVTVSEVVPAAEKFTELETFDTESFTWTIGGPPNHPPVVTDPEAQTSSEGEVASLQVVATDEDPGDSLVYSATNLPPGLSIDAGTGLIGGTIAYGAASGSPYAVEVIASDGEVSDGGSLTWTVIDAPPAQPAGLDVAPETVGLRLEWADNAEADLAGYNVYRIEAGSPLKLNATVLASSTYLDAGAPPGETSSYEVIAVDAAGHESAPATGSGTRGTIVFRGSTASRTRRPVSPITLRTPAGIQSGDLMLASISVSGAPTDLVPPAGWTEIGELQGGPGFRQFVFARWAGGSEPPRSIWTPLSPSGSFGWAGTIVAYGGVDGNAPLAAVGAWTPDSPSIMAPSVSGAPGQVLVGFFGIATIAWIEPPSDMLEHAEAVMMGRIRVALETSDGALETAGDTGPRIATASNLAANVGQVVLLTPAP